MKLQFVNGESFEYVENDIPIMYPRLKKDLVIPFSREEFETFLKQTREYYLSRGESTNEVASPIYEYLKCVYYWREGQGYTDVDSYFARNGHLEQLKLRFALGRVYPEQPFLISAAARGGQVAVLDWLHEHKFHHSTFAFAEAARYGQIAALDWLHAHNYPMDVDTIYADAVFALCSLDWLHAHDIKPSEWSSTNATKIAASSGKIEALEWFRAHNYPMAKDAPLVARDANHLDCVKWLADNGLSCSDEEYADFKRKGQDEQETLSHMHSADIRESCSNPEQEITKEATLPKCNDKS